MLLRATAIGVLIYLIMEPPSLTLAVDSGARLSAYVETGYWVALVAAIVSLLRPSLILPAAFYCISARMLAWHISGIPIATLDIVYIMEMGQFLGLGVMGLTLLRQAQARCRNGNLARVLSLIRYDQMALCLAFVAIGFHLGNYFWSGYQKLMIGPHVWTWITENGTQNLIILALAKGTMPLATFPGLTQALFDIVTLVVIPLNLLVVLFQLFAIASPLRVRWLVIAALAYDALHIGIYLLGGFFFWPWIWNNGSIIVSIRGYRDDQIGAIPKLCCILAILAGGSDLLGRSARLAWFDVVDIKIPSIQAEAPDHNWVDVPPAFFLSHSYAVSHGYIDDAIAEGHYAPSIWGSVYDYQRARTSGQCVAPPPLIASPESPDAQKARLERVEKYISAHHKRMLLLTERYGENFYYFRFHHHPTNPWLYTAFNRLDLQSILRYRIVTRSVCLRLSAGKLEVRELKRDVVTFDVR